MLYELEHELGRDIPFKTTRPAVETRPLLTGETAPPIGLNWLSTHWVGNAGQLPGAPKTVSIFDELSGPSGQNRPLVVSFYCPCWGGYARPFLTNLIRLYPALQVAGAELIVFSNEPPQSVTRTLAVPFLLAQDLDFGVARAFGLYSEINPVWDRISGISDEVYTPGLYLLSPDRRIHYHFIDENFDRRPDDTELIEAIRTLTT